MTEPFSVGRFARPIPCNLISGFLGAGKTSLIRALLASKPVEEKWAVLVNEFGEVGVDGAIFQQAGIAVTQVAGGCMCCVSQLPSAAAMQALIEEHRPDRILVEPTGLAEPDAVLRQFSGAAFRGLLELRAVVCVIDPWSFAEPQFRELPAFAKQLAAADILVASKADIADAEHIQALRDYAAGREDSGLRFALAPLSPDGGGLTADWLALPHRRRSPVSIAGDAQGHSAGHPAAASDSLLPHRVDEVQRRETATDFAFSCSWLFPDSDCFELAALRACLERLAVPRVKVVLPTEQGWQLINCMRNTLSSEALTVGAEAGLGPPRIEMISTEAVCWQDLEPALLACRLSPGRRVDTPE